MPVQTHLRVDAEDTAKVAVVPGDPGRVDRIADHCDAASVVADHREYRIVDAEYRGRQLTICSTGIGCPSAAIAVEELAATGVETFLRIGTTGALQSHIEIGDMVVLTAAAKEEGTTKRYESPVYPAVATQSVVDSLTDVAEERGEPVHHGPGVTDDAFYVETEDAVSTWEAAGLLCVEMEAAAIFTLARRKGLRAGAICTVDGNLIEGTQKGDQDEDELPPKAQNNIERAIRIGLQTAVRV